MIQLLDTTRFQLPPENLETGLPPPSSSGTLVSGVVVGKDDSFRNVSRFAESNKFSCSKVSQRVESVVRVGRSPQNHERSAWDPLEGLVMISLCDW